MEVEHDNLITENHTFMMPHEFNENITIDDNPVDVVLDIVLPTIFALICVLGLTGNTLVVIIVKQHKSLHSTTNILLANLAIADLLTLLFGIPNAIAIGIGHPGGTSGAYLCKFITGGNINAVSVCASVITLTVVAAERYNAIVKPMRAKRRLKKRDLKYVIPAIWIISGLVMIPMFVKTTLVDDGCASTWNTKQEVIYKSCLVFHLFIIPLFMISFCYIGIVREIYFPAITVERPDTNNPVVNSKRKLLTLLLLVTLIFLVFFGAYSVAVILYELELVSNAVYNSTVQCLFAQSAVNPIIYMVQSANYRAAFLDTLRHCKKKRQDQARERPENTHNTLGSIHSRDGLGPGAELNVAALEEAKYGHQEV